MIAFILAAAAATATFASVAPFPAATAATPTASASPSGDRLVLPPPKPGRARPLIVVVAENVGAETTDFAIPYGVLKDSGVADVRSVSTATGPVHLFLPLTVKADETLAEFDAREPAGADVVIVPAQKRPKDPALSAWLRGQAAKGATVVSVCEGARVLANAGLLDGRRATTHWHALHDLEKHYPKTTWVRDRRYVQDGRIISTTGVSASIPMSLALVEAIGGRDVALATARRLGAHGWSARHRTAAFTLTPSDYANAIGALAAFWRRETVEAPIENGVDEIGLALRADTWARTFRAKVVTTHAGGGAVRSKHGLVIVADQAPRPGRPRLPVHLGPPLRQLDRAVEDIAHRYGDRSARLALLGMEYAPAGVVRAR
jgi:transcriptional regulator GlxA family with amidase domain